MANVEHSLLTGASLHEPKGVESASSGEVYVADGLGTGAWSALSGFNAFGGQLLHVRDQRTSGSAAQSLSNVTWEKRDLQTTPTNEISDATLSSSVISLPAGTYYIDATASFSLTSSAISGTWTVYSKIRLRNTTDGADLLSGQSNYNTGSCTASEDLINHGHGVSSNVPLKGRFTLAGTKNIELQSYVNGSTRLGGTPISSGSAEVYADVMIWKLS